MDNCHGSLYYGIIVPDTAWPLLQEMLLCVLTTIATLTLCMTVLPGLFVQEQRRPIRKVNFVLALLGGAVTAVSGHMVFRATRWQELAQCRIQLLREVGMSTDNLAMAIQHSMGVVMGVLITGFVVGYYCFYTGLLLNLYNPPSVAWQSGIEADRKDPLRYLGYTAFTLYCLAEWLPKIELQTLRTLGDFARTWGCAAIVLPRSQNLAAWVVGQYFGVPLFRWYGDGKSSVFEGIESLAVVLCALMIAESTRQHLRDTKVDDARAIWVDETLSGEGSDGGEDEKGDMSEEKTLHVRWKGQMNGNEVMKESMEG